jgi:hypothetical protein
MSCTLTWTSICTSASPAGSATSAAACICASWCGHSGGPADARDRCTLLLPRTLKPAPPTAATAASRWCWKQAQCTGRPANVVAAQTSSTAHFFAI